MFFCLKCNNAKLDMDNHSENLCKDCFIKAENDYWKNKSMKARKTRSFNDLIKSQLRMRV